MASRKGRKFELSVFIRPGHPRFSSGRLDDAQRCARNTRTVRRAYGPRQLRIRGRICIRIVLRSERNTKSSHPHEQPREQHSNSSTQQLSRPFEPLVDTAFSFPRFHYSQPGRRPVSSLLHLTHSQTGLPPKGLPGVWHAGLGRARIPQRRRIESLARDCIKWRGSRRGNCRLGRGGSVVGIVRPDCTAHGFFTENRSHF